MIARSAGPIAEGRRGDRLVALLDGAIGVQTQRATNRSPLRPMTGGWAPRATQRATSRSPLRRIESGDMPRANAES